MVIHSNIICITYVIYSELIQWKIMKKTLSSAILTTLICSTSAFANEGIPPRADGFDGFISLIMAKDTRKNNFNTHDSSVKHGQLNSEGSTDHNYLIVPLGRINYTFGQTKHTVFAGTSISDIVEGLYAFELGYSYNINDKQKLTIAVAPRMFSSILRGETWQDPYMTEEERKETDLTTSALRVSYDHAFNTPLNLSATIYGKEIDNEKSGVHQYPQYSNKLERDGTGLAARVGYGLKVQSFGLEPYFTATTFDADGDAMSYDGVGIGIKGITQFGARHIVSANIGYVYTEFDTTNPIFDKKQETNLFKVNANYLYRNLFIRDLDGTLIFNWSKCNSNITFYDTNNVMYGAGLTWHF